MEQASEFLRCSAWVLLGAFRLKRRFCQRVPFVVLWLNRENAWMQGPGLDRPGSLKMRRLCENCAWQVQSEWKPSMPSKAVLELRPTNFAGLMDALKEVNRVMFSPERFLKVFSMDQQTLALRAHVHRNTVRNAPESEKVQAYIRDSVKVLRAVTDMGTDVTNAIFWFKNEPLSTFNYKTAEEVVSEGKTEQLIAFLQSWGAGAQG